MCISFTDVPLQRQEEIWVETIGYAASSRSSFWPFRREMYERYLREKYAGMDTADLVAHKADIEEDHKDDPQWAPVIDAVTEELKARANRGNI